MDLNDLKNVASNLQQKAEELMKNPDVQNVVNKGKEYLEKGKDWAEDGQGKEYADKGKDALETAKEKLEDFVKDKTDGKGILGFGAKK